MKTKEKKTTSKRSSQNDSISSVFLAVERLQHQDDSVSRRKRSTVSFQQQRASSQAAISQQKVYTKLLETRILLQRSLQHQLQEQQQQQPSSKQQEGKDEEKNTNTSAIDQCNDLLIKLLTARRQLQKGRDSAKRGRSKNADDDDDDTMSVDYKSLVLNQQQDDDSTRDDRPNKKPKKSLEEQLEKEYKTCQEEWQSVLNRRHYDVRLHTGAITAAQSQFRVVNSNFWQQVEATVVHQKQQHEQIQQQNQWQQQQQVAAGAAVASKKQDDDDAHDSGSDNEHDGDNADDDDSKHSDQDDSTDNKKHEYYCYPPFDDAKVYQQLLKDFVAVSSADHASQAGAASDAARARLDKLAKKKSKLQSSSSSASLSKPVDRRASKGRKIRYTTISKLVNFTFPLSRGASTIANTGGSSNTLDEDAWFKSLFGGTRLSTSSGNGAKDKKK